MDSEQWDQAFRREAPETIRKAIDLLGHAKADLYALRELRRSRTGAKNHLPEPPFAIEELVERMETQRQLLIVHLYDTEGTTDGT